jgi:hypothetical protein
MFLQEFMQTHQSISGERAIKQVITNLFRDPIFSNQDPETSSG